MLGEPEVVDVDTTDECDDEDYPEHKAEEESFEVSSGTLEMSDNHATILI